LREPNSFTQVSLTNRIPREKSFLNLTAARAAAFKHGRIQRGEDSLAPGYTVPAYQGEGYLKRLYYVKYHCNLLHASIYYLQAAARPVLVTLNIKKYHF